MQVNNDLKNNDLKPGYYSVYSKKTGNQMKHRAYFVGYSEHNQYYVVEKYTGTFDWYTTADYRLEKLKEKKTLYHLTIYDNVFKTFTVHVFDSKEKLKTYKDKLGGNIKMYEYEYILELED